MTRPKNKQARKPRYIKSFHDDLQFQLLSNHVLKPIVVVYTKIPSDKPGMSTWKSTTLNEKRIRRLHKWLGKLLAWIDAKGER
jgi:hypothetical protein